MGGLWRMIPITYALMWVGSLALAGIWPFAGFYSKDIILEAAYAAETGVGKYAFWLGAVAAFLTAFYSWRLLFMTFHGKPRGDEAVVARVHESPMVMLAPLFVLALGALTAGFIGYEAFVGHDADHFWNGAITILPEHPALRLAHDVPLWVKLSPLGVGIAGIALAYLFYMVRPDLPGRLASAFSGVYRFLLNKWYFDELYDALFVRPSFVIGRGLWKGGDGAVIDGVGPDGIAAATVGVAQAVRRVQSGYIYHYAFAMLIGVMVLISWYFLRSV
jgi:NADH-quinone oxidoreductase subunit L